MEVLECPQCGAPVSPIDRKCKYCKAELYVTDVNYLGNFDISGLNKYVKYYKDIINKDPNNIEGILGLGLCYLQLGNYQLAQNYFEELIKKSPYVSQPYYYSCLSIIRGRRLMILSLNEIRQAETYLNTAIQLDPSIPQYKLLLAMIKRDYYETNGMKVSPPAAEELLAEIKGKQIGKNELKQLRRSVKVSEWEIYF